MRRIIHVLGLAASCNILGAVSAGGSGVLAEQLKQLTLDELLMVEVTSVSKTSEHYELAAAAITVVTNEHILRSGATNLPDTLRWVPGLHVARRDSNSWGISSRGFSSTNSEKLLVLSDTRSVYTPLFSGVFWDVQNYLLADIERIEVIRGPGAALWGSNAVNGVINITTKHAADTQGTRVETGVGTEDRARVTARYGGRTKGDVYYRVFGAYFDRGSTFNDSTSSDDSQLGHMGFRADWSPDVHNEFTLQGEAYAGEVGRLSPSVSVTGRAGPTGDLETRVAGGNLLGRWRHQLAEDSDIHVRAYYDWTHRDDPSFEDDLDTVDLDVQHRFTVADRHQILWGLNFRHMSNRNVGGGVFAVEPASAHDRLISGFVQDQMTLGDALHVTLGTKWEHNDFSGTEWQPSARAAWEIAPTHTAWAAVSKAVRIPTRLERDIAVDVTDPNGNPIVRLLGNTDFEAEDLLAFEIGYRWRVASALHVDVSLFDNHYGKLASLELSDPFIDPRDGRTVIPIVNRNLTDGRARGAETLVTCSPLPDWRLSASYSYLHLRLDPKGQDLNRGEFYEDATPRHQFALGSYLTLPHGMQLDVHFRSLSSIRRLPEVATGEGISAYNELDIRLAWQASERMQLSLVGQNLLHPRHVEGGSTAARGQVERGVYAQVAWEL